MAIDRDKLLQSAQGHLERKRYDKAIAEFQKLLAADPHDARILLKLGDAQSRMSAHAEAVGTYEKVARFYAEQGFALKAVAVYKQIREMVARHLADRSEQFAHITPALAQLYTDLKLVSDAAATWDEVAARLVTLGQESEAREIYRKVVQLDPGNPLSHLRLAEAHSRVGEIGDAVTSFRAAIDVLLRLGRRDDSLKVLERLLHHRADTDAARRAAALYLERGGPNDGMLALAKLQVCFQADAKNLETLNLLARAFSAIGQPGKAIEVHKEMARLAHEQGQASVYRRLVEDLARRAPHDEAVQRMVRATFGTAAPPAPAKQESSRRVTQSEAPFVSYSDAVELSPDEYARVATEHPPADEPSELDRKLHQVVAHAESFRKVRLYSQSIRTLRDGLERAPRAAALHTALKAVLIEAGDTEGALEELLALASISIDALDVDDAARQLHEALQLVPREPRALQLLAELGLAPDAPAVAGGLSEPAPPHPGASAWEGEATIAGQPLPADLAEACPAPPAELVEMAEDDERTPVRGTAPPLGESPPPPPAEPEAPRPASFFEVDPLASDLPLPSFPAAEGPVLTAVATLVTPDLESTLAEVDFCVANGMLDDARALLEERLADAPDDPLLLARWYELSVEPSSEGGASSEVEPSSAEEAAPEVEPTYAMPPAALVDVDDVLDLDASIDALDALPSEPQPEFGHHDHQVDVDEVFAKFKAGIRANVSDSDSQTHYDLGLAYREMQLIGDAIDEFEIASRDPARTVVCQSMVAMLQRGSGNLEAAIDALMRALDAEQKDEAQELGLLYELGDTYSAQESPAEALFYFRRVVDLAPDYDDPRGAVATRIAELTHPPHPGASAQLEPVDDGFDAAFDALESHRG